MSNSRHQDVYKKQLAIKKPSDQEWRKKAESGSQNQKPKRQQSKPRANKQDHATNDDSGISAEGAIITSLIVLTVVISGCLILLNTSGNVSHTVNSSSNHTHHLGKPTFRHRYKETSSQHGSSVLSQHSLFAKRIDIKNSSTTALAIKKQEPTIRPINLMIPMRLVLNV